MITDCGYVQYGSEQRPANPAHPRRVQRRERSLSGPERAGKQLRRAVRRLRRQEPEQEVQDAGTPSQHEEDHSQEDDARSSGDR